MRDVLGKKVSDLRSLDRQREEIDLLQGLDLHVVTKWPSLVTWQEWDGWVWGAARPVHVLGLASASFAALASAVTRAWTQVPKPPRSGGLRRSPGRFKTHTVYTTLCKRQECAPGPWGFQVLPWHQRRHPPFAVFTQKKPNTSAFFPTFSPKILIDSTEFLCWSIYK